LHQNRDAYHWGDNGEDITAYVLRNDWHGWSAGTVCFQQVVGNFSGTPTGISQYITQDGIWESVWTPKKSTTRMIFSKKAAAARTQKDIDDLKKFEEETEKSMKEQ
jgi:hypothetical protein